MNLERVQRLLEDVERVVQPRRQLVEMTSATVGDFLNILMGALTRYDQALSARETKRGGRGNIYRLAHYAGAVQDLRKDVHKLLGRDDAEALEVLKKAIAKRILLPPADRTIKKIDAWIRDHKYPSYV